MSLKKQCKIESVWDWAACVPHVFQSYLYQDHGPTHEDGYFLYSDLWSGSKSLILNALQALNKPSILAVE